MFQIATLSIQRSRPEFIFRILLGFFSAWSLCQQFEISKIFNPDISVYFSFPVNLWLWKSFLILGIILALCHIFLSLHKIFSILLWFILALVFTEASYFNHLGDRALLIFLIWYIFLPINKNSQNEDLVKEKTIWQKLFYLQVSLIYGLELILKYKNNWLSGNGLEIALAEKELQTSFALSLLQNPHFILFLNYLSLSICLLISVLFLISFIKSNKKVLFTACVLGISYHIFASLMLYLDWLSLAQMIPFLVVLAFTVTSSAEYSLYDQFKDHTGLKNLLSLFKKPFLALALIFVGYSYFYGYRLITSGAKSEFDRLPFQQKWDGYAPPSPASGLYRTSIQYDSHAEEFIDDDFITSIKEEQFHNLRYYKLFRNMRNRNEDKIRKMYLNYVCHRISKDRLLKVSLFAQYTELYPAYKVLPEKLLLETNCLN